MDFTLSKRHLLLQKLYRDFAEKEVKPLAQAIDEEERFPVETVEKMVRAKMMGICFPVEYQGSGADTLAYAMAVEELSKVCGTTGVILSAHTSLGAHPIYHYGTPAQKEKYLTRLCNGTALGAFGLTEPNAGTDAAGQQTIAIKKDDHYVPRSSSPMPAMRTSTSSLR
jgi:butyryl-CoA dehydrogenase